MSKRPNAKRANRPNPRSERRQNYRFQRENDLIKLEFSPSEKKKKVDLIPRGLNQEKYVEALTDDKKPIVFAVGPAGTGKSYLGTLYAIRSLKAGLYSKLILTKPNVAVDRNEIGFLPGDVFQKLEPWVLNILDIFAEYYSQKEIAYMIEEKVIEVTPIGFLRGRSFKDSLILGDELQNLNPTAFKTFLTRIGENSKIIITGDLNQSDIGGHNGLQDFLERLSRFGSELISVIQFGNADIERHPVIRDILRIYQE